MEERRRHERRIYPSVLLENFPSDACLVQKGRLQIHVLAQGSDSGYEFGLFALGRFA